jgi:hypothetical protein
MQNIRFKAVVVNKFALLSDVLKQNGQTRANDSFNRKSIASANVK